MESFYINVSLNTEYTSVIEMLTKYKERNKMVQETVHDHDAKFS